MNVDNHFCDNIVNRHYVVAILYKLLSLQNVTYTKCYQCKIILIQNIINYTKCYLYKIYAKCYNYKIISIQNNTKQNVTYTKSNR